MKYKAVIFDLFGTLMDNLHHTAFMRVLERMATAVQAPIPEFAQLWNVETWPIRSTGQMSISEVIVYICRKLGVEPAPEQVQQATKLRYNYNKEMLIPRPDAIETLTILKNAGYLLGLISDCTEDTAYYWPTTALAPLFDAAILSSEVGMKKPDPRIFLLACERLGVEPGDCLYMGDGGSNELSGAMAVGMHPVLIRAPYENAENTRRQDEEEWDGPRISAVKEILAHVDSALVL